MLIVGHQFISTPGKVNLNTTVNMIINLIYDQNLRFGVDLS